MSNRFALAWGTDGTESGRQFAWVSIGGVTLGEIPIDADDANLQKKQMVPLEEYGAKIQALIETKLGRPLTDREGRRGLEHRETRDELARLRDVEKWKNLLNPPPAPYTGNPYALRIAQEEEERERKSDPKMYDLKQAKLKWDADQKAAEEWAAKLADPKRQAAVQQATHNLVDLLFDERSFVTQGVIDEARFLLDFAKTGDLETLGNMTASLSKRLATVLLQQKASAQAEHERLQREIDRLNRPTDL